MSNYIDLLVAAGWIESEQCICNGTRKGVVVHNFWGMDAPEEIQVDCWECTDRESVNKHIALCSFCVQPYKRRRPGFVNRGLSPAIPPNYTPMQSPPNSIENPETGKIKDPWPWWL